MTLLIIVLNLVAQPAQGLSCWELWTRISGTKWGEIPWAHPNVFRRNNRLFNAARALEIKGQGLAAARLYEEANAFEHAVRLYLKLERLADLDRLELLAERMNQNEYARLLRAISETVAPGAPPMQRGRRSEMWAGSDNEIYPLWHQTMKGRVESRIRGGVRLTDVIKELADSRGRLQMFVTTETWDRYGFGQRRAPIYDIERWPSGETIRNEYHSHSGFGIVERDGERWRARLNPQATELNKLVEIAVSRLNSGTREYSHLHEEQVIDVAFYWTNEYTFSSGEIVVARQ